MPGSDHDAPYAHLLSSPHIQRALEASMTSSGWIVSTPFAREHFGKGKAEGSAEGKAEGRAESILRIAERRDLRLSPDQIERLHAATDLATLDGWFDNAITAETADDIFR